MRTASISKFTIFTILILLFTICNAQSIANPRKYFEYVNKAELAICDSNYYEAITNYKHALQYLKEPFGKDIYNLLHCALNTEDKECINLCIVKYKERDYKLPFWMDNFREKKIGKYFDSIYAHNLTQSTINYRYKAFIEMLLAKDQSIRYDLSEKTIIQWKKDSIIYSIDSINMTLLKHYIDSTGVFPTESVVGNEDNFPSNPILYTILLIHYAADVGTQNVFSNPINLNLNQQVLSGNFSPEIYAHLCGSRGYGLDGIYYDNPNTYVGKYQIKGEGIGNPSFKLSDKSTWNIKYEEIPMSVEEIKAINKKRDNIYMESNQDFLRKVRYLVQFDYPPFQLVNNWFLAVEMDY